MCTTIGHDEAMKKVTKILKNPSVALFLKWPDQLATIPQPANQRPAPSALEGADPRTGRRSWRTPGRCARAVADQDRDRQHRAIQAVAALAGWHRLRVVLA